LKELLKKKNKKEKIKKKKQNKMDNTTQNKTLLATLSQCVADRDKAAANIASILESNDREADWVSDLKDEFKKMSQAELTIESIQVYYAKYCELPNKPEEKKEEKNDNIT
jgi:hypothetical protein